MAAFFKAISNINAAIKRNQVVVSVPKSNLVTRVLSIMAMEGFIRTFEAFHPDMPERKDILVHLAYTGNEYQPVLKQILPISKPGRRVFTSLRSLFFLRKRYRTNSKFTQIKSGKATRVIVSTHKGVMLEDQALALKLGGELICKITV